MSYIQEAIGLLRPKSDGVHCINCGKMLVGRRKTFCCDKCYRENYKRFSWNRFCKKIRVRDKKCQFPNCVVTDNLEVHHIKPVKEFPEFVLDPSNTICFCSEHHKMVEYRRRRRKHIKTKKIVEDFYYIFKVEPKPIRKGLEVFM